MKKAIPKIALGFFKDGLKINSKQFNPLNMSICGFKMENDKEFKAVDPIDLLETLETLNVDEATKQDKIKALKAMLQKVDL